MVDDYVEWICDFDFVKEKECNICFSKFKNSDFECVRLIKCFHYYHNDCITKWFKTKQSCPLCNETYGKIIGTQPDNARMSVSKSSSPLPGYNCDTLVINYSVPNGIQSEVHPNPGKPYQGTSRTAYIPNNTDGNKLLPLLKQAFEQKLIFNVGTSLTTGQTNVVTWSGIHHKTSYTGAHGYPDQTYFERVFDELKNKGIV